MYNFFFRPPIDLFRKQTSVWNVLVVHLFTVLPLPEIGMQRAPHRVLTERLVPQHIVSQFLHLF